MNRHAVQWRPDLGYLKVQTLVSPTSLCPLNEAADALASILLEIAAYGIDQAGPPELWRLDVSADCRFAHHAEGRAVLAAVANAELPRTEVGTRGRPVETVMFYAPHGKTQTAAIYDKGLESGTAPPGELIRFEARKFWRGRQRPHVADLDPTGIKSIFDLRFGRLPASSSGLSASTPSDALQDIARAVKAGTIDMKRARRAFVALCEDATDLSSQLSPATAARRRKALREVGLSGVQTSVFEERPVAIGPLAVELLAPDVWGLVRA